MQQNVPSHNQEQRINWIDEYKGFVLLLVCLYHVEQSFTNVSMGMEILSACRMSAFFFISGVLFSTRRFDTFKSYFIHKSKVLLLPYITLSLLFLLLDPVVWNFDLFPRTLKMTIMNTRPEIVSLWDYIYWNMAKIFVAGKSSIGSGPLWFVFTLYSISLMFYGIQNIQKLFKPLASPLFFKLFILFCAAASLTAGWILYKNHIRLPLGIERDFTTLSFFALGWVCRNPIKSMEKLPTWILVAVATISFATYTFTNNVGPWFSIMNNELGKSFWGFLASSLLGITGLVATFIFISRIPCKKSLAAPLRIFKGILQNISRNALIVLAVHWYILLVLRIVFKIQMDKPGIAYLSILIVTAATITAIPLFRCKLYKLIGKEKITIRESLNIL